MNVAPGIDLELQTCTTLYRVHVVLTARAQVLHGEQGLVLRFEGFRGVWSYVQGICLISLLGLAFRRTYPASQARQCPGIYGPDTLSPNPSPKP